MFFLMLGHFYLLHLFMLVMQCFSLPQLTLWGAVPKSTGLEEDLPAQQGFRSGSQRVRSHPYRVLEAAAAGIPSPPIPHQLLCGLGTRKHLVNLEEIFRKLCAERWRLRALWWIKCNSSEFQFWLRRNCALVKSVVRPGQINVIQSSVGMLYPQCLACG